MPTKILAIDDSKTMRRQILEPVKFRLKSDPPNPPSGVISPAPKTEVLR